MNKKIIVEIGGKDYSVTSDDDYLDHIKNGFEPVMVHLFKNLIRDTDVVLDVGANIGCTALLFGDIGNKVYAFEPSPTTFQFLEQNVSDSGLKNVCPVKMGLGDKSGEYTLTFSPSNRSGGFVSNQTRASEGFTVEDIVIRRLDDAIKSLSVPKVDFIKIDVEGFEAKVLKGAEETLAEYRPTVVLELNHWCLNALQRTSIPDFFDFLRSQFPILLAVDGEDYMDLHNENDTYIVMYHHIIHMKFPNILAAFDDDRIKKFKSTYRHGFAG